MLASQKTCFSPGVSITLHSPCKLGEQAGVIWVMSKSRHPCAWPIRFGNPGHAGVLAVQASIGVRAMKVAK